MHDSEGYRRDGADGPGTVVFADISGFTAMSEKLDPEDVRDLMNSCFGRIEAIVAERGGVVEKWIGDCVMASFGVRFRLDDAPFLACDAALHIRAAIHEVSTEDGASKPLDVHVGINTGLGIVNDPDDAKDIDFLHLRKVVGIAVGLEGRAANGQILVGADTRRATLESFEYTGPVDQVFEDIDGIVAGYLLHGLSASASARWKMRPDAEAAPLLSDARTGADRPPPQDCGSAPRRMIDLWSGSAVSIPGDAVPPSPRASSSRRSIGPERRQPTVLFADISGVNDLSEVLPAEQVRETMNHLLARIEEIVRERGGVIDKWIGDGAMALFGARVALERAPLYACDAALAIRAAVQAAQDRNGLGHTLDVRIGINTGLVIAGDVGGVGKRDFTVMGRVVNMAARLMAKATRGEILVSGGTRRFTRADFLYSAPKMFSLKGIVGQVPAYSLEGRPDTGASWKQIGCRRAQETPLVGREREMAQLSSVLRGLSRGRGSAMFLAGESGLGKSRLLTEFMGLPALRPVETHVGFCVPVGRTLSYHPIAGLVQSWMQSRLGMEAARATDARTAFVRAVMGNEVPEISTSLGVILGQPLADQEREGWSMMTPAAQERSLQSGLGRLLVRAAATNPLLLAIEDLHWADDSSLSLLEFLIPLVREHPIAFLLVYRPDYEETSGRLAAHARQCIPEWREEVPLGPLSPQDTTVLLRHHLGAEEVPRSVIELILERTSGNPLFVEELVDDLLERRVLEVDSSGVRVTGPLRAPSMPQTIEGVILSRAERLSGTTRTTLETCSVLGRQFAQSTLAALESDQPGLAERLRELLDARFLVEVPVAANALPPGEDARFFEFRHAMLHDSIYQSLTKNRRRGLHAACARVLEQSPAVENPANFSTLAYHFLQAQDLAKAEEYLFRAGERAAETASSREALRYFRDAYESYVQLHGSGGERHKRARLEKYIGLALLNTGRLVESVPHLNAALRLHGEWVPTTPLALHAKFVRDLASVLFTLYFRRDAGRASGVGDRDRELFEIHYNRCRALNPTDPRRAFFDNMAAIRHLRRMNASQVDHACGIYSAAGAFFAFSGLSFSVSRRLLELARELAEQGNATDRFQHRAMRFVHDYLAGNWNSAPPMPEDLLEHGLRAGLSWDADVYLGLRAELEIKQGRFEDAEVTIGILERLNLHFGYSFSEANILANRSYLLVEKGELADAWTSINRYYESRDEDTLRLIALSTRAKIEVWMGRLMDAKTTLAQADRIRSRAGRVAPYYELAHLTAALFVAVINLERGLEGMSDTGRVSRNRCSRLLRRAVRLAEVTARDRVQVYGLASRYARVSANRAGARRWFQKAMEAARALHAAPDEQRLYAEVATVLHNNGFDSAPVMGSETHSTVNP